MRKACMNLSRAPALHVRLADHIFKIPTQANRDNMCASYHCRAGRATEPKSNPLPLAAASAVHEYHIDDPADFQIVYVYGSSIRKQR